MARAYRRVDAWLFAPGSAWGLAAVRIGLCSVLAVRLARPLYAGLGGQPAVLFRPRSFMHLLPAMPPRPVVMALQVFGVVAAVLAVAGVWTRVSLPVAWVCGLFLNGMFTSLGKIMHNDVLLLLALVPLLAAPVDAAWSLDPRRRGRVTPAGVSVRYGWPVRAATAVVAGAYLFAGLAKLEFSGLAWAYGDNLKWALLASSLTQHGNSLAELIARHGLLFHAVAWGTLLLEVGFPVILWRPRAARVLVPGAVALHAGIFATMHLDYTAQVATVIVVCTNWLWVADRVGRWRARRAAVPLAA